MEDRMRTVWTWTLVLWAAVIAAMVLASCGASKNVEQQVSRDYSGDLERIAKQMDSLQEGFNLTTRQVTDKLSNLKVEHTTTYYTQPDSAGRQYPVYVSTTRADKDEQTTQKAYSELSATIRKLETAVDSLSRKVDAALLEEQKVAELSWWDLHKDKVLGAGFVALLVVAGWLAVRMMRR